MTIDQYYILLLISFAVTALAQLMVKLRYNKYKKVSNEVGLTGKDVARRILDKNGMRDIPVLPVQGTLTDNYNPTNKTVNLSQDIYNGTTIAGIAVAAHECGHAIQHNVGYPFLKLRTRLVPILNVTSKLSYITILLGYVLGALRLFEIGIILESVAVLFQLVTLPVEFDASRRGMKQLRSFDMFSNGELAGSRKMLTAAALTYVGAALSGIVSLLRLVLMMNNSRKRK